MYAVVRKNIINKKWQTKNLKEAYEVPGFVLPTKNKCFNILGENIKNIKIVEVSLGKDIVSKYVKNKYQHLIKLLTELLVSDDDTGTAYREALNRIEKFRQEIKNKYRIFLENKELEKMAKQLKALQKTAKIQLEEISNYIYENSKRGKGK